VAGTPYFGSTYHSAGNDPLGSSDPLGQRPVTDQELREIRDRMGSNFISRNKDWIIAGALIVGGIAVMATGFGGPLGAAMIGGALLSAGSSAAIQKVTTGEVNYTEVAVAGLIGGAAGGLGYGAGALVSGTSKAAAVGRGALAGGVESFAGGAANRGIHGRNPFDPAGMATDLLVGGGIGGVGGRLGAGRTPDVETPDLAGIVARERAAQQITPGRNGAVFEYQDAAGDLQHVVAFSQRGVGHAERLAAKEIDSMGVPHSDVQRIYSNLEPCDQPGGYCARFLAREFPDAEISYSHPYPSGPENAEVRRASVEAMRRGE
jgi:hypothetical protein